MLVLTHAGVSLCQAFAVKPVVLASDVELLVSSFCYAVNSWYRLVLSTRQLLPSQPLLV